MGDTYTIIDENRGTSSRWNQISNQSLEIHGMVKNGVTDVSVDVFDDEEALEGQLIIWNTIYAFASSMALKAAILLDIPDILAKAGPEATLSLEQIAAKLSSKAPKIDFLRRILRFLAVNKIISQTAVGTSTGVKEWRYGLTNASRWLVKNNDFCLAPLALMELDKVTQAPWHVLNECVVEGGADAFERANGKDMWSYAKEFPDFNNLFNEAMVAGSKISIATVLRHYDGFKDLKTLADVGGGLGLTASKIVSAYPHIKCINFDLPHVVAAAPSISGVEHVGGDMFESVPSADAIVIKASDWLQIWRSNLDPDRLPPEMQRLSIFHELPYLGKLMINHLLDLVHIFKNVGSAIWDHLIGAKYTKDTRDDLKDVGRMESLWPQIHGNKIDLPKAPWILSKRVETIVKNMIASFCTPTKHT